MLCTLYPRLHLRLCPLWLVYYMYLVFSVCVFYGSSIMPVPASSTPSASSMAYFVYIFYGSVDVLVLGLSTPSTFCVFLACLLSMPCLFCLHFLCPFFMPMLKLSAPATTFVACFVCIFLGLLCLRFLWLIHNLYLICIFCDLSAVLVPYPHLCGASAIPMLGLNVLFVAFVACFICIFGSLLCIRFLWLDCCLCLIRVIYGLCTLPVPCLLFCGLSDVFLPRSSTPSMSSMACLIYFYIVSLN